MANSSNFGACIYIQKLPSFNCKHLTIFFTIYVPLKSKHKRFIIVFHFSQNNLNTITKRDLQANMVVNSQCVNGCWFLRYFSVVVVGVHCSWTTATTTTTVTHITHWMCIVDDDNDERL